MRFTRILAVGLFALAAAGMATSQAPGQQKGPGGKGKNDPAADSRPTYFTFDLHR